ncbi:MAG: hypothetical protein K6B74_03995 [Ruminococcus sp.]|nr:hypothetical protein [Ruminococcus sp.]
MAEVFIAKDANTVKYIPEIRRFDSSLSIGEIKSRIENGTAVFSKELITYGDIYYEEVEGIDPHTRNMMFFSLIERLIGMGAELKITEKDREITPDELKRKIMRIKEISDETEMLPD